jgi:hypothetical protein
VEAEETDQYWGNPPKSKRKEKAKIKHRFVCRARNKPGIRNKKQTERKEKRNREK